MSAAPRLLVFDLDGTLIDSSIDLTNSVNAMLAHFGEPALADSTVASYIGDGVAALVRRALAHAHLIHDLPDPHDETLVEQAVEWFIRYYRRHKLDYTTVYPGVMDALAAIRSRHPGLAMAVLTNKPVRPSREICAHFGMDRYFFKIYGGDSFPSKKPVPSGLLALMAEAGVSAAETVMIGDSHVDVETARACGARSLGCTFGLSPVTLAESKPDLSVDTAMDWPAVLGL